jgi:serine/threonine protein kinase
VALKIMKRRLHTLGDYAILEAIGRGAAGSVYRARHRTTSEIVAVKVLPSELATLPALLKRFEQEFRVAHELDHPNIVRALDFGQEEAQPYLVMEYVEGQTLGQLIADEGRLSETKAVRILVQVAQGLHSAHKRGIIHRDVKPDNILLRTDGQAKLADLGLVKDIEGTSNLTTPDTGLGTPHFMPPEQYVDARKASIRSDIYSLGATLYMAVTGHLPFGDCNSLEALEKKVRGEITAPRQLNPDLSEHLDQAIRRAMSTDPLRRPSSCLEFVRDITGRKTRRSAARRVMSAIAPLPSERRAAVRYPSTQGSACRVEPSVHADAPEPEDCWPATLLDVSTRGMGLLLARRFEPGTELLIEVEATDDAPARSLRLRVTRVRRYALGHWNVGGVFSEPLSAEDVQSLL